MNVFFALKGSKLFIIICFCPLHLTSCLHVTNDFRVYSQMSLSDLATVRLLHCVTVVRGHTWPNFELYQFLWNVILTCKWVNLKKNAAKVWHRVSKFKLILSKYFLHFSNVGTSNFWKQVLVWEQKTWVHLRISHFNQFDSIFLQIIY